VRYGTVRIPADSADDSRAQPSRAFYPLLPSRCLRAILSPGVARPRRDKVAPLRALRRTQRLGTPRAGSRWRPLTPELW